MNEQPGRRWLVTATAVLVVLIAVWVLAALQLNPASAGASSLGLSLRSRLLADYSGEDGGTVGSLSLSIVGDLLRDLGLGGDGPSQAAESLRLAMLTPVPSATAVNFAGDPPPTLTHTASPPPTETETPAPSATSTRRALTATPSDTPRPGNTAAPSGDTKEPEISGGSISPGDGSGIGCAATVTATDIRVFDHNLSGGLAWVKLKYEIAGSSVGYIYSNPGTRVSGGWTSPGQTWDAEYDISLSISFTEGWASLPNGRRVLALPLLQVSNTPTPTHTPDPSPTLTPSPTATHTPEPSIYDVYVYVIAQDNAGNSDFEKYATYTMTCP